MLAEAFEREAEQAFLFEQLKEDHQAMHEEYQALQAELDHSRKEWEAERAALLQQIADLKASATPPNS